MAAKVNVPLDDDGMFVLDNPPSRNRDYTAVQLLSWCIFREFNSHPKQFGGLSRNGVENGIRWIEIHPDRVTW